MTSGVSSRGREDKAVAHKEDLQCLWSQQTKGASGRAAQFCRAECRFQPGLDIRVVSAVGWQAQNRALRSSGTKSRQVGDVSPVLAETLAVVVPSEVNRQQSL